MHYDDIPLPTAWMKNPDGRHMGGANYLLADGHSKFYMPKMVSCGYENDLTAVNNPAGIPCGGKKTTTSIEAAATSCGDATIAATFNVKN
jgi:prepilin-type processing-associated H-X9-DG protein